MKIFLTGDNHIGLKYLSYEKSAEIKAERMDAFSRMVDAANRENCALFVISGDLFENNYSISKRDISALLDMLSLFKGNVLVLPGNHDFYNPEAKLWQYFEEFLKKKDNILLLKDYRPYHLDLGEESVTIYPALCTSLHSLNPNQNNLEWICESEIDESVINIGVAHGAVEGETIDSEGEYFLMSRSQLESIPLDLWLIGHTHVPFPKNLTEEYSLSREKIFNAGTHSQTDVACNTEGNCFIIEIDSKKQIRAKKYISGELRFYRLTVEVTAGNFEEALNEALANIPGKSVVEIIPKGALNREEYERRKEILDGALAPFFEGSYSDYNLTKLITEELIIKEFPETSLSAGLLLDLIENPKEAQLAYEMLKTIKEGK